LLKWSKPVVEKPALTSAKAGFPTNRILGSYRWYVPSTKRQPLPTGNLSNLKMAAYQAVILQDIDMPARRLLANETRRLPRVQGIST